MAPTPKATTGTVGVTKAGVGNRLSASDWVQLLSAFGPAALSAIGGAGQASYDRKRQEQLDALDRAQADYLRRQGARAGLSSFYADQLAQQRSGAQALANAMPLGAEQDLATRMALLRGLSAAGQAGPAAETSTNPALRARLAAEPTRNLLAGWARPDVVQAISPEATARSLAERRKALAGLDPNFQFGSMGDYGVPDLGGEVSGYASSVQGRRAQAENTLLNYLQQQMDEASQPLVPTGPQTGTTGQTTQKKTPWWKRALKVAATAAPIVAAPFTSGATLALIGAGSGALAGGLDGGMKGAMMGGALGATAGLGGGGAASTVARQQGESVRSAIQRSILNPQALTRLAGAGIGGDVGQAMSIASSALPGAREYQGAARNRMRAAGVPEWEIPGTPGYEPMPLPAPGLKTTLDAPSLGGSARPTFAAPGGAASVTNMPMATQATQQGMFGQPPAQTFGGWNATQGMFAPQAPATPMSAPVTGSRPPLPRVTLPPQAPGQPGQPGQPPYFGDRGVAGPTYFGAPGAPLTPPMPTQMLGGLQAPITYGNWGNATATSNFLLMMLRNGNLTYPQYLQALQRMGLQPPRPAAGGGSGGGW